MAPNSFSMIRSMKEGLQFADDSTTDDLSTDYRLQFVIRVIGEGEVCRGQWRKQTSHDSTTGIEGNGATRDGANQERQEVAGDPRPLDAEPDRHKRCWGRLALFLEQFDVLRLSRFIVIVNENREFPIRVNRDFNRRIEVQARVG